MRCAPADLALFVFVDALGYRLARRYRFLEDVAPFRHPLRTEFGYSSACDPTILTGAPPDLHGHFSFYRRAERPSAIGKLAWLERLPSWLTGRSRVRHHLSRLAAWHLGYTGYFQLYNVPFEQLGSLDYSEKRDLYLPGGINAGLPTVVDELRYAEVPFYWSDWRRDESWNTACLRKRLDASTIRWAYLYLPELDGVMHTEGTRGPRVEAKLAELEETIRSLLEMASERYSEVHLHLFSDHGMTDVLETCDLAGTVDRTGLQWGVDYHAVYDSTMARFWFGSENARLRVAGALAELPGGRILTDEELRRWGCGFPDQAFGEMFYLLDPGILLCPGHMGARPVAGMHGYDPDHRGSVAVYQSNVEPVDPPRDLRMLRALMRSEAGLER